MLFIQSVHKSSLVPGPRNEEQGNDPPTRLSDAQRHDGRHVPSSMKRYMAKRCLCLSLATICVRNFEDDPLRDKDHWHAERSPVYYDLHRITHLSTKGYTFAAALLKKSCRWTPGAKVSRRYRARRVGRLTKTLEEDYLWLPLLLLVAMGTYWRTGGQVTVQKDNACQSRDDLSWITGILPLRYPGLTHWIKMGYIVVLPLISSTRSSMARNL